MSLYVNENHVERMFKLSEELDWTWQLGGPPDWEGGGALTHFYHMHGDPAKNHAGFPLMVAHYDRRYDKVMVDWGWRFRVRQRVTDQPLDEREYLYDKGEVIDYETVETFGDRIIDKFHLRSISFDQWNSIGSIQHFKKYARDHGITSIRVFEETFTGPKEYRMYEKLRTELANERVVCPRWIILARELNNVIDNNGKIVPPDVGPVRTKDVADCLAVLVTRCLEDADEKGRHQRDDYQDTFSERRGQPYRMPAPAVVRSRF